MAKLNVNMNDTTGGTVIDYMNDTTGGTAIDYGVKVTTLFNTSGQTVCHFEQKPKNHWLVELLKRW